MQDVKQYYPRKRALDGKEIFSEGWAVYNCPVCGWSTKKWFENIIMGFVPCDQCGLSIQITKFKQLQFTCEVNHE